MYNFDAVMKRIALLLAVISLIAGCKKEVLPETISLNWHTLSLEVGETSVLEASVTPSEAAGTALVWSSTQPSVATVDNGGLVTAVGEGRAIIMVTTVSGTRSDACTVTVNKKSGQDPGEGGQVGGVKIIPASLVIAEGVTAQLTAVVTPATSSQEVEWASQSTGIATVDDNGVVTGISQGSTKIFARSKEDHNKQAFCEVTVNRDPTLRGISFGVSEISLAIGEEYTMNVIYIPSYADNKAVSWTSDNEAVASVSSEGKVTGVSDGVTIVTATSEEGGFTAKCEVIVGEGAGVRYYHSIYGDSVPLYLNGSPDPMSGAYEEIVEYASYSVVKNLCSEGSDLYSIEDLVLAGSDGNSDYYLCKNRRPLAKVPHSGSANFYGMAARDGRVAVIDNPSDSRDYFVVIYNPDGSFTTSKLSGSFSRLDYTFCIWTPSGDLHVVTHMQDVYNEQYLADYKYSKDGTWKETLIAKEASNISAAISEEGDIYALANIKNGNQVVLYKNGEVDSVVDNDTGGYLHLDLCVKGGNVYTVVSDVHRKKITIRRDADVIQTIDADDDTRHLSDDIHSLYVTSRVDIYLAAWYLIFKNSKAIYSTGDSYINHFCVIG